MDEKEIIRFIANQVAAGESIEYAERIALNLASKEVVQEALQSLQQARDEMANLKEPTTIGVSDFPTWYPGPLDHHKHWPGLRDALSEKGLSGEDLDEVDRASTKIVSRLGPPNAAEIATRGLVLGHVQSGKTTNFSAVMAKAADAGYRLFIVLSGLHNALREQTQSRLEQDLVTAEERWFKLTHDGDFHSPGNAAAMLSTRDKRCLAVVKKNSHRLRRLIRWLDSAPDAVRACPILVVDDEADQASINVGAERRSAISRLIRDLLSRPKAAYVGYTATPFANVLVDPHSEEDLYPRDFIMALKQPREHMGTETIFGRERLTHDEPDTLSDGEDMVRHIPEVEVDFIRPPTATEELMSWTPAAVPSLRQAILYFILATAARRARGQTGHSSMLIHTTMRVHGQAQTRQPVQAVLDELRQRVRSDRTHEFETLWNDECERVQIPDLEPVRYNDLVPELDTVLEQVRIVVENSASQDRLVYDEEPQTVIAIGGNTLSRGLTLEGLVVSYFLRVASAYDTLLQMGRWFGYRQGYRDLPRVWMTSDLHEWFIHLATVEAEIRADIDRYEREHLTPMEAAVRIRQHPALAVTSRAKMGSARRASISFAGARVQTFIFNHRNAEWLARNLEAGRSLLRAAIRRGIQPRRIGDTARQLLESVPAEEVRRFLANYEFHEKHHPRLSAKELIGYIDKQGKKGALLQWNVVVIGGAGEGRRNIDLGLPEPLGLLRRSKLKLPGMPDANVKAIMSKEDRVADLCADDPALAAEARGLSDDVLRERRPAGVGLLILYPIDRRSEPDQANRGNRVPLDAVADVLGVGIVFPDTEDPTPVSYVSAALEEGSLEWQRQKEELDALEKEAEALERADRLEVEGE